MGLIQRQAGLYRAQSIADYVRGLRQAQRAYKAMLAEQERRAKADYYPSLDLSSYFAEKEDDFPNIALTIDLSDDALPDLGPLVLPSYLTEKEGTAFNKKSRKARQ